MAPVWSRALLGVVVAATVLSGCLGVDEAPADPGLVLDEAAAVAARLAADVATLPCEPSFTQGQTSPVYRDIAEFFTEDVMYGEIDVVDGTDLLVLARFNAGGFDLVDVSDPYAPLQVASFPIEGFSGLDVKASKDGTTVFVGSHNGITVVDISDPAAPALTRVVPLPDPHPTLVGQAHMLHVSEIGGEQYVFSATPFFSGVLIFKVIGEPGDIDLEYLTIFAPLIGLPMAAHDMMVYHDPIEKKPILWVANGFGGIIAADVSDPASPEIVSFDPELDPYQGYTHTISVTHYGDRRIAVTMAEIGAMAVKVYDVTNMAVPILLATWSIDDVPVSTQHNTQILGDWMWLGHYGEGVVVFNLTAELDSLALPAYNVGVVTRAIDSSLEPFAQFVPEGNTWESVVVNGVHWTTATGLYGTLSGCFAAGEPLLDAYV